ncbi:MAG: hypothetical protein HY074_18690 [Deltaproteobacteria bacterium]|nr:hypothetical protein [Deltaproteobacteria bacterium]
MAKLLTQSNGPFNQKLVGQTIETEGGRVWLVGTELAMGQVDPKAAVVRDRLSALTGQSTDAVLIASALTGSLARLKVSKVANDLDFESLMIAHVKEGNAENLHNPESAETRSLASFFQAHVEQVLREHADYRFIELKAGEYIDAATGETKGIKWWLEDVRRGYKEVVEPSGQRTVNLAEVFAEDARVKADWAVPGLPDSPVAGSYTEASVLYRLGIKVGNNQVRLRVSRNGHDESLPVRATTVALDPEDMSLLLEASQAAPGVPLEQIHQMVLISMKKYQKIDHLKIIKRVFSLLQFWDEVDDYNILHGTHFTQDVLSEAFLSVMHDPEIMLLGQLKAQAELLQVVAEHGLELPNKAAEAWIAKVRDRYDIRFRKLDRIIETITRRIDKALAAKLEALPQLNDYVHFVAGKIPFMEGALTEKPVFLTLQPQAEFRAKLARAVEGWKTKFPNLRFSDPNDAHMTIQFLGRMTPTGIGALMADVKGTGEGWSFEGGGAHIMGRNSNLIALAYNPSAQVATTVNIARAKASSFGARPEKRFRIFVPHITLASFDVSSPASRAEAQQFLQEATSQLETVQLHGFEVWTRNEAGDERPAYRPYKP